MLKVCYNQNNKTRKDEMKEQAKNNRIAINHIKNALDLGLMSYDEAKEMVQPIIDSINARAKEIAKDCGVKPKYVNFTMLMR